jgi:hypothetical protein
MPGKKQSRTATVAVICLIVALLCWIIIPRFWHLLLLGDIDSAIGTMRTLVDAESNYAEVHPGVGYTCTIADLDSVEMLRKLAKSGQRNGYAFELSCPASEGTRPRRTFQVTARPLHADLPAYCSDQSGVLRYDEQGSTAKCLQNGLRT